MASTCRCSWGTQVGPVCMKTTFHTEPRMLHSIKSFLRSFLIASVCKCSQYTKVDRTSAAALQSASGRCSHMSSTFSDCYWTWEELGVRYSIHSLLVFSRTHMSFHCISILYIYINIAAGVKLFVRTDKMHNLVQVRLANMSQRDVSFLPHGFLLDL